MKTPPEVKRVIYSSKEGFIVKETYPNGIEVFSEPKTRWELRAEILRAGVCEHTAEKMLSEARSMSKIIVTKD